jgi:hypothetical protein
LVVVVVAAAALCWVALVDWIAVDPMGMMVEYLWGAKELPGVQLLEKLESRLLDCLNFPDDLRGFAERPRLP